MAKSKCVRPPGVGAVHREVMLVDEDSTRVAELELAPRQAGRSSALSAAEQEPRPRQQQESRRARSGVHRKADRPATPPHE